MQTTIEVILEKDELAFYKNGIEASRINLQAHDWGDKLADLRKKKWFDNPLNAWQIDEAMMLYMEAV